MADLSYFPYRSHPVDSGIDPFVSLGFKETKSKQVEAVALVRPTRPCQALTPWSLWTNRVSVESFANAGETTSWLRQPEVDGMPSATDNSKSANGLEFWTKKARDRAFEGDEYRLLYNPTRGDDKAAVPIARPMRRLQQVRIPGGGPKPQNNLQNGVPAPQHSNYHAARGKPKVDGPALTLQASRGDNVSYVSHSRDSGVNWAESSPKRQKIKHQASPPSSSTSVDEVLDSHRPEDVHFEINRRASQDLSIRSINSHGSGFKSESPLAEHKRLERMMSSAGRTKKKKSREANQIGQNNHGLPAFTVPSTALHPIDLSGGNDDGAVQPKQNSYGEGIHRGTTKQPSTSPTKANADTSRIQGLANDKVSPHFAQPTSPSLPARKTGNTTIRNRFPQDGQDRNSRSSEKLDQQFLPTSGQRRSLDHNMSSDADELQLGTTVGTHLDEKALCSIAHTRNQSPSKNSPSTLKATSPIKEETGLDPSHIRSSKFTVAKPKHQTDLHFPGPPIREKKAPWAVDVAAVSISGTYLVQDSMGLVYDEPNKIYVLKTNGKATSTHIPLAKLVRITWEDSGRRMRFRLAKSQNQEDTVDLELRSEKDVALLVKRLQVQSPCRALSMSSEQMVKMFEKRRSEIERSMISAVQNAGPQVDLDHGRIGDQNRGPGRPESSPQKEEPKGERPKRSIVSELCARAALEEPPSNTQPQADSTLGESVSALLERLQPKFSIPEHNQHLRRSSRTSSEFKKPYQDLLDNEDDDLAPERYSKTHGLGEPWKKPLIYPKVGRKKATVEFSDLERLDEGQFLNDNLLSFYLLYLECTLKAERPDLAKRVYFFNTYFFATLMSTHKGKKGFNYEGVQKWTRSVDLFTYDYIVVPINEYAHWYLAIICNLPALDRTISSDDAEVSSPGKSTTVTDNRDPSKSSELSSSPARGFVEESPINLTRDQKEPDEKTARNSFAEMTLDGDIKPSMEDLRENHTNLKPTSSKEDQEMLDIPILGAMSPSFTNESRHMACNIRESGEKLVVDADQDYKGIARSKKSKRASAPPAITKTDPDKPVIITFDSLGMTRSPTVKVLKDYLREEARAKRGGMEFEAGHIKGITARQIPQQENGSDCGLFLLGYVAKFLEANPRDFTTKIIRREYDEINDWPNLNPSVLRNSIRDQIMELHRDQVAERQKERQGAIDNKPDIKQARGPLSTPAHAATPARTSIIGRNSEPVGEDQAEKTITTAHPSRPVTRKEALQSALTLEAAGPKEDAETLVLKAHVDNDSENLVQNTKEIPKRVDAKSLLAKLGIPRDKESEQQMPSAAENEPSVIYVESQSQQDGSAPKSFMSSHPAPSSHTQVRRSPELPAEIKDSQPSQTSQAFARIAKGMSGDENDEAQEIPIIPLASARQSKRRRLGNGAATVVTAEDPTRSTRDRVNIPNQSNQGYASAKRKRGRPPAQVQVQKSDEVINIDDDD